LRQASILAGQNPIYFELGKVNPTGKSGGVEIVDCQVYDFKDRPFLKISDTKSNKGVYNIKGNINVYSPYGAKVNLPSKSDTMALKINSFNVQN